MLQAAPEIGDIVKRESPDRTRYMIVATRELGRELLLRDRSGRGCWVTADVCAYERFSEGPFFAPRDHVVVTPGSPLGNLTRLPAVIEDQIIGDPSFTALGGLRTPAIPGYRVTITEDYPPKQAMISEVYLLPANPLTQAPIWSPRAVSRFANEQPKRVRELHDVEYSQLMRQRRRALSGR